MKIVVCCKVVPNSEDLKASPDGTVDVDMAEWGISEYDLQALQAGVDLAAQSDGSVVALTAGPKRIDASALKKDILSRGVSELYLVVEEALADADAAQTSKILAKAVQEIGADVVICGEGSADRYCQQTGSMLGEALGFASINAVDAISVSNGALEVDRLLESEIEMLEVPMPAVLSVTSSINVPPLPSMKSILMAAKKPQTNWSFGDLGFDGAPDSPIELVESVPPAEPDRKKVTLTGSCEEMANELVAHLKQESIL